MANYTSDLAQLETDRSNDLSALDNQYSNAIKETEAVYDKAAEQYVIDANDGKTTAVEQLMETQTALTNQAIAEIEQEREQNEKDYIKEQAASYADWQKQSDAYGVNAEKMASNGLTRSGYSESSQVQMYSDYQARVTSARETFKRAELNFTNAITNARLQNNAALAQIALDAFQKQSEIAIQGLTAKNGLLSEWTSQKIAVNTMYDNRYQTILDQIYREEQMQLEREKMAQDAAQFAAQQAQSQAQFEASMQFSQEELNWKKTQDQLNREEAAKETAKTEQEEKYDLLADLIMKTGHPATDAELAEAGMTRERANSYLKYYNENKKTNNTTLSNNNSTVLSNNGGVVLTDNENKNDTTTYPELYNPFPTLGVLNTPTRIGSNTTTTSITRNQAVEDMKKAGVPATVASSVMTQTEWTRHKNSGSTNDAVQDFATYEEYLRDYAAYAIANKSTNPKMLDMILVK